MELKEIMTTQEQRAVEKLIAAHLNEEMARLNLVEAQADLETAAQELTDAFFRTDDSNDFIGTIPPRFVAYFQNEPYLIEVDEDGDSGHRVSRIAGILNQPRRTGDIDEADAMFTQHQQMKAAMNR